MKLQNASWWRSYMAVGMSSCALFSRRGIRARLDGAEKPASSEKGQSLVEMALVLPILLTFVIGLMQICMAFYTHECISELARQGTRYAIVHGSTCWTSANTSCTVDSTGVATYVKDIGFPNIGGGTLAPEVTYLDGDEAPSHRVKVSITYKFPYNIPFIPASFLSMTTSSTMYIIQ
jgi:Flp pilus assembly protein TadG